MVADDVETGVSAALASAGLTKINVGGLLALPSNYEALKNDTQDAWTAYPLPVVAYRQIDSFSLVFDDEGNYIGVKDFRERFLKLWQAG